MVEEWEKSFENKYAISNKKGKNPFLMFDCDGGIVNMPYTELKSFISSLLSLQKIRTLEEVEEMVKKEKRTEYYVNLERADDQSYIENQEYNEALSDLLAKLTSLKQK